MVVKFYDPVQKKELSYYLMPRFQKNLDRIKEKLQKFDKDYVLVFDGNEGSGKSVFAMQSGKYVDPTLDLSRICMSADEFKQAIINAKPHQCVIFDEAFRGLSSRSSLSEVNRMIVSMMMEMRQKNLFVIICLPTFFMLDKYVALFRAQGLIHIYEKHERRYFMVINKRRKKQMFLTGNKTYSYGKVGRYVGFKGRFYNKYVINEEEYRKKKKESLENAEYEQKYDKYLDQRNRFIKILHEKFKVNSYKIADFCKEYEISLKRSAVEAVLLKFKEKPTFR